MGNLRDTVLRALEFEGAVVEPIEPDGLQVLAPHALRTALDLPELARLGFGPALPAESVRVSLESDWMDKLHEVTRGRGRFLRAAMRRDVSWPSREDIEVMLAKHLILKNATYRIGDVSPTWTRYLVLAFHLTAISDEKREDILSVCVNEFNGACADSLVEPLFQHMNLDGSSTAGIPDSADPGEPWTAERAREWCDRNLPGRIRGRLQPFLGGMERRMSKDLERLRSYYSGLQTEAARRLAEARAAHTADDVACRREQAKLESVERQYRENVADMGRKYAMKVEVELIQAAQVAMLVCRTALRILRRKGVRPCHFDWNPFSKRLDDLPCEGCGAVPASYVVCDRSLHITCPECGCACGACGKPHCAACHPAGCPNCGY